MSPTMRRVLGRSTRSSTRRSSSRMATRVSRGLPLINISRFKACALDPARPAAGRDPNVVPARTLSERIDWRCDEPIGREAGARRGDAPERRQYARSPMHTVNISGLATYVNCPEITADDAPIQRLSLTGGSPVRHAARPARRRGARPNPAIPGGTPERRGGRLPRYSGPGSVPLARGPGRARDPSLDRGGESPDRELAVRDTATRDDPQATDRAVELSQVRGAVPQSGSVLLLQERRPAEPVGALQAGLARGRSRSAARPEPPVRRRHDRALHARGLGGRPVARLRDAGERLGLGGVPRARRRDGAGP